MPLSRLLDAALKYALMLVFAVALASALPGTFDLHAAEQAPAAARERTGLTIDVHDAIGPATSHFFIRTLERAQEEGASLLVVSLDTPGGLDTSMRDMIRAILASSVPVVMYVSPSGARAASAGTYLLYASHVAAMAPATNLGAATPVNIGTQPQPSSRDKPRDKQQGEEPSEEQESQSGTAMERKAINDAVAYIRGLAELRGRNADWAEAAVKGAASLSAREAHEQNVVDIIATDVPDLLRQLNGREIKLNAGTVKLDTTGLTLERVETDWRTQLLAVITNPNVAYLLMLIGVYGLLLEGYSPGAIVPGVVGAICLLLALYAFQVLSVNYAGLALMLLGIALIVAEAFAPSFGALGLGGLVAFVVGSIILMDADVPGYRIARSLIGSMALLGGLGVLGVATLFARSRRRPVVSGGEQLVGDTAVAIGDFDSRGQVRIHGEIWNARTRTPIRAGQDVRIVARDGLTLTVEPVDALREGSFAERSRQ
jgi:membrane-bound serine protease (ClpP class)